MNKGGRLNMVGLCFTFFGLLIAFQIARTQVIAATLQENEAQRNELELITYEQPERGIIYDRWGHGLAGNIETYEVGRELQFINPERDAEPIARELSPILGVDYQDVLDAANTPAGDRIFITLADFVSVETIAQIDALQKRYDEMAQEKEGWFIFDKSDEVPQMDAIMWNAHLMRSYPEHKLASNVLGFYAFKNLEMGAVYGVEEAYDKWLAGETVEVTYQLDPGKIEEVSTIPQGANVILTIDREIQATVEGILDHAVETSGSSSGTIVVLDPETGEILAMAVTPRIDPNNYGEAEYLQAEQGSFNRAIDLPYEPGSVFKVLTMAAALDSGGVTPDTVFIDTGQRDVGGFIVYNWDGGAWGPQTMVGCMQHSLNVCLAHISMDVLGASLFYDYMDAFRIGYRTSVDLAGEVLFPLSKPGDNNWYESSLGTNSFGQGLAVTPLQLATAISAVANDGQMMAPHVVRAIVTENGYQEMPIQVIGNPISAETAHTLTEMLAQSLEIESSSALVDGYRVAGKTGTAQVPIPGGYDQNETNASFVGWGPADDPKFLIYIWLEKPQTSPWGSIVAAPVFRSVASQLVVLMNIPPDDVRQQLYAPQGE